MRYDSPDVAKTAAGSPPKLSQRGRDLLSAIRGNDRGELSITAPGSPVDPAAPARLLPVAFLMLADETIDAELAGLALARQLVGPLGESASAAGRVALLMLDPLGATLRLAGSADRQKSPPPRVRLGPQQRAANRADWAALLARLPQATRLMLVLDTTGQQHNLVSGGGSQPTVIVITRTGAEGRLAGYRTLKELTLNGAGQIGIFFVDTASADDPQPAEPFTERARAAFARLAETAGQFLNRSISYFGATGPATRPVAFPTASGGAAGVVVDLLGQRPSLDRQENRQELTRWLADHAQPLTGLERSVAGAVRSELLSDEELAELHSSAPAADDSVEDESVTDDSVTDEPITDDPVADELVTDEPITDEPVTDGTIKDEQVIPLPLGEGMVRVGPTGDLSANGGSQVAGDLCATVDLCATGDLGATSGLPASAALADHLKPPAHPGSSPIPLPVVAVANWPTDYPGWRGLIRANPRLAGGESALSFHPPVDPATVLLAKEGDKQQDSAGPALILARFAAGSDLLEAAAGLSASIQWARQHWPLLRLAYPQASLPDSPRIEPVLLGLDFPAAAVDLFRARFGELKLARLLRLELPAGAANGQRFGVAVQGV